ncbi:MAG: 2OG-Fe(II) oxygenase [Vicingaceae bacterium]
MSDIEERFEQLIEQIVEQEFAISDHFFPNNTLVGLLNHLKRLQEKEQMKKAGIGQAVEHEINRQIRGDEIKWLPKESRLDFEIEFNRQIQSFMSYLNRSCFLSLNDFEFHYTCYPEGTFYKKHIDRFQHDSSRQISFIVYLNQNWEASHGGEVVVYPHNKGAVKVAPTWGRVLCFRSHELAHEVLATSKLRYSVTGWLKSVNADKVLQLID